METELLSADLRDAYLSLLDDPSPAVRQALIAEFQRRGASARGFLQETARGPHRVFAWHAARFLRELGLDDPVEDFLNFIRSPDGELETGALLLCRTVSPGLDPAALRAQLDALAARARELISHPATPRETCRVLNRVLFHECGLHGSTARYTDPRNSFLDQVLSRRQGLPITLSLIYLFVARRLGLALEPVGLPGHFVVGCYLEAEPFFIDPFNRGLFHSAGEILARLNGASAPSAAELTPTPAREVLCRCCRNLVNHCTAAGEPARARLFTRFVDEFEAVRERHAT